MPRFVASTTGAGSLVTFLFALYDVIGAAAVWLLLVPFTLVRVLVGLDRIEALRQRLGFLDRSAPEHVLIHGVSVGEILAAEALVGEVESSGCGEAIVLSTTTRHGLEVANQIAARHPAVVACRLLPWDSRRVVRRWLQRSRPRAVVVIETELWPNLFRCCSELGIPIAMASARIYRGDLARYVMLRPFFARVLSFASLIGAQSVDEAVRFRELGAALGTLVVLGNLKSSRASGVLGRGELDGSRRFVVVAGCTHAGEEKIVLAACRKVAQSFPDTLLVIAPRDVERAREVTREAARCRGLEVRVVDRIGELSDLYRTAAVAFIGGSLVKKGGHNPLEALAAGCPVVMGPYFENVESLAAPFRGTPGLAIVTDERSLGNEIARYLAMDEPDKVILRGTLRDRVRGLAGSAGAYAKWIEHRGRM